MGEGDKCCTMQMKSENGMQITKECKMREMSGIMKDLRRSGGLYGE
jgi:hypothetical protein